MDDRDNALFELFFLETNNFLTEIERILLEIEEGAANVSAYIPELFRIMHTIKSSAAMTGFEEIASVAHATEDLFGFIRDNPQIPFNERALTDILFTSVDFIQNCLLADEPPAAEEILKNLRAFLDALQEHTYTFHVRFIENCPMIGVCAFQIENSLLRLSTSLDLFPAEGDAQYEAQLKENGLTLRVTTAESSEEILRVIDKFYHVEHVEELRDSPETPAKTALPAEPIAAEPIAPAPAAGETVPLAPASGGKNDAPMARAQLKEIEVPETKSSSYINVPIARLNEMMDLAGELIIAEMKLSHAYENNSAPLMERTLDELRKLVQQLQSTALTTRMVTLHETFHKLARLTRDISGKLGKEVNFITSGEYTELDKWMVDHLLNPLTHLLRNAIDHGLESAEERIMLGKPARGTVRLTSTSGGKYVTLRLSDDGRGFDRERILRRAIHNNFVTKEKIATMTEDEIDRLAFLPGLSTNSEVSEYSGRGVGLDIVSDAIKRLRGTISIKSKPGEGTTFIIHIPLTLSTLDSLIVRTGEKQFILPVADVKAVFKLAEGQVCAVNGRDSILYKEACYHIQTLSAFAGQPQPESYEDGLFILLKNDPEPYTLYVDEVTTHRNVVVKPIPELLKSIRGISACSILGDGSVTMILDTHALYEL